MSVMVMRHLDAEQAADILEELVQVYVEVYAESDDDFFGEERYRKQLTGHMTAGGFELVTGSLGGEIVGYVYGFTLPENARWWRGLLTEVPPGMTAETGRRTFGLCEIMVRQQWQGRSLGHALHDELLSGRPEERATLLAEPDNPAHTLYVRWGWQVVGQLRPSWDGAPTYDALVLPLPLKPA